MPGIIPLYPLHKNVLSDEPVVKLDYKDRKIEITYFFPGFTISDDKRKVFKRSRRKKLIQFQEVKISGSGFLSQDQEPLLPSFGRFVQIPRGYCVVDVKHVESDPVELKKVVIKWAEETVKGEGKIDFDEDKYKADEFWPKDDEVVEVSRLHYVDGYKYYYYYIDGYKVILVHVRPLQYNPKKELLRGYGKIIVTITLERAVKDQEELALTDQTTNLEGFGNLILNPSRSFFKHLPNTQHSSVGIPAKQKKTEFLVIYGRNLKRPAEKLKEWKKKRGLETEVVPIGKILGSKKNVAEKIVVGEIKDYIRNIRLKPSSSLRYVLLFGDVDKIPVSQNDKDDKKYTDHYFFTHKDADDSECILPWVSGGRIPVKNAEKGMSVVKQIIRYETKLPNDPAYYKRMTFASYFQDSIGVGDKREGEGRSELNCVKAMEDIRKHMICLGYEVNRVYLSQSQDPLLYRDGTPVSQEVKEEMKTDEDDATELVIKFINKGQRIVAQTGHGETQGWKKPSLKIDDLESISTDRTCVFFNISCSTGRFHFGLKDKYFAGELLASGVAASVIAANDGSQRWRNDSMVKALFDAIWPGIISTFPKTNASYPIKYHRLGDILNYAKAYLLVKHGFNKLTKHDFAHLSEEEFEELELKYHTKEQIEMYHIIGDPTLEIW
jgi:hypothetical protein